MAVIGQQERKLSVLQAVGNYWEARSWRHTFGNYGTRLDLAPNQITDRQYAHSQVVNARRELADALAEHAGPFAFIFRIGDRRPS